MTADPAAPSDEELLARHGRGDPHAFPTLVRRYERPLFNFLLRSTRDRHLAADLVQDVFVKVVQSGASFEGRSKFSTWLYTIARNLSIDSSRKQVFRRHRSLDAATGDGDGPSLLDRTAGRDLGADRTAISAELGAAVARAIEALPSEQREVFLLRQAQGMAFKDIAEVVGVPENTVKSRMRYALERLQEALREYEDYVDDVMHAAGAEE